ncbi:MAG TPA: hypothetical protein VGM88_30670 [Kofleriaceae bacterium]|jgi:hypothetical protein
MRGPLLVAALACGLYGTAHAAPETYPLTKVHRGQTGYGMTTFAGSVPERFTFEVVDIVHNFLPMQDLILVKSDDPKMAVPGFWQGMSGSPLYLDDKLVCAFSYGFRFNKLAIGGCTPIDYMKKDGESVRRGRTVAGAGGLQIVQPVAASMTDWHRIAPTMDVEQALAALPRGNWLTSAPLPAPVAQPSPIGDQTLQAAVPLSVSGFTAPAYAQLAQLFAGSDVVPMRSGGSGGAKAETGPGKLTMGGPIAVEILRGDMSAAAIGTVSYIDGNQVLAFGHPMFQSGETYAPVSTATVATVIPSSQSAFVMASPQTEVGSLTQDRQSSITADLGLRVPMIPMDISIVSGTDKHTEKGSFHVEILPNKFLTPTFAGAAVMNAVQHFLPDKEDVTARVESVVRIKGQDPIAFVDYLYAADGAASVMGAIRGIRVLVPLFLNPYGPVQVESVDIKIDLRYEANYGELKEISVPTGDLYPGHNVIAAKLQTYDGKDVIENVPVEVPATLVGSIVQVEVTSGDAAKLDGAPPVDLPTLLAAFRKLLPGNTWAVTIYPADDGVAVDGKAVRDLPQSAMDKLHPESRTQRATVYKSIARTVTPTHRVVNGSTTMLVRVRAR